MIRAYLSAFFAGLVALGAALLYRKGRNDADDQNEIQEHNEYIETRKRMDQAPAPSDADVQRWLHERGKYKRDL